MQIFFQVPSAERMRNERDLTPHPRIFHVKPSLTEVIKATRLRARENWINERAARLDAS